MTVSEQVGRIRELFEAASESEGAAREALLRRAGEGDPGLRELIEQMLRADSDAHSILDHPLGLPADSPLAEPALKEGDTVGAYRILRKIGDGGMGVVYLAERDSELFAIKMMLGPSPAFTDRFLQERAILTRLHHSNIASFVDSGQTDDKMLYLVMEYVEGQSIHRYCEQERLSVNRIIQLFRQVCAAVIYLHQNLVVHRDLKPGNILVTPDGRVKLVDFGIAKLLPGHQYPALAAQTAAGAMTPYYASPEQVRGGPTSTLTDVFTLGILLYELLTGINPFSDQNTEVHETLRRICEDDPLKPSATSGRAHLRGEMDNIVLKAMEKQPSERYASVEQFDSDLGSFLAGLPVLAQGSSIRYRASKFARRYWASVAVAVLVFVSLCGGVIATTVQARIASRERARAEAQAQAAETARTAAELERNRAEIQTADAKRERANAERRLAELQKVVENTVRVYRSTDQTAVPQSTRALMAENARDSLLALGRESELGPGFTSLLPSLSAEVRGYQVADANAAWQVPQGWSASSTKSGEYRVGIDRQFLYQGKPSLFLSSLVPKPNGFVNVAQRFSAEPYKGARVRFVGFLQTASVATRAYLVLTIIAEGDSQGVSQTVSGTNPWRKYEVVMDVPDNADFISIAAGMTGTGTLWAANLGFERVGLQVPLTPKAPPSPQNLNFTAK
jgi:predicted Ser/Thr protein kinase